MQSKGVAWLVLLLSTTSLAATAAAQAAAAQAAPAQPQYHVVEVHNSESTTLEQLLSVIEGKLGADREKAMPLIERINKNGKAVLVAGTKEACEEAATHFHEIGLKTEVRPLSPTDMPSAYDDSDVIPAGAAKLQELLSTGEGVMVTFYAPWCGHCKTMVDDFKQAATTLKESGIRVAAIDGQQSPTVAQQLGVRGYPTIMWLHLEPPKEGTEKEVLRIGMYEGARNAASFVEFAKAASASTKLKSNLPQGAASEEPKAAADEPPAEAPKAEEAKAEGGGEALADAAVKTSSASKSKLGGSKLGGSKLASGGGAAGGITRAKMPAEAAAEKTEPEQPTDAQPVAAAAA